MGVSCITKLCSHSRSHTRLLSLIECTFSFFFLGYDAGQHVCQRTPTRQRDFYGSHFDRSLLLKRNHWSSAGLEDLFNNMHSQQGSQMQCRLQLASYCHTLASLASNSSHCERYRAFEYHGMLLERYCRVVQWIHCRG
jgi:hypothetical protein